ncbi:beta-glucosidase [Rubrivirga marina]|uniref:Beta-glucosidase n=1 Tax=Rubrivirga marina TaxID=1196024 RepID=A0A271IYM7_9BACT|nr:beta-glucosidase [Rubrivirga marina]PAP76187.1 beta-glucosidase [Rubrivirga marina]
MTHNATGRLTDALAVAAEPSPFQSFWMGGFECSSHRRRDGARVDVVAASGHDRAAAADYRQLAAHGIRTVRDGVRWPLVERSPGRYDWSSFLPQLRAARETETQVIWDLCHYGVPDGLDVWGPTFVRRFEAFARAAAEVVRSETDGVPWWCPVNEISFWSWAGGDAGYLPPFANGRGFELKVQLARAALGGVDAVRDVDRRARLLWAEPAIHVACDPSRPHDAPHAEGHRLAQFQAWDLLAGHLWPQVGGSEDVLDVLGVNYYPTNQWVHGGPPIGRGHPQYRPLRRILTEVAARYGRPVVVAETGSEGDERAEWLRYVAGEVRAARAAGVRLDGVCWYPIANHPGWDDDRHCPNGLLGYLDPDGARPVHAPLARELARWRARLPSPVPASAPRRAEPASGSP